MTQPAAKRFVTEGTLPELVQDAVAAFVRAGTGITFTYEDTANTLTIGGTATGVIALTATAVKTQAYAAAANELIPVDASAGSVTVVLPTAPATGSRITVKKIDAGTNTVILTPGGSDVFNKAGGSVGLVLSLPNQSVSLQYGNGIWIVVSSDTPLSQLDTRYEFKGAASGVNAADLGYDIVLLLGQSNMVGAGTEALDSLIDTTDPRIWTYGATGTKAGTIAQASDPLAHRSNGVASNTAVVGPGMEFARWYLGTVPANRRVLLVPAAYNGTAILSGTPRWDPTTAWANDSTNLYNLAIAQALAARSAAGPNARIVTALWVQGESDALAGAAGTAYRTALEYLIDGLRSRLTLPNLPFVIGSMTPEFIANNSAPTRVAIDAVHVDTPNRKAYTAFVRGPSGMGRGDNLHYSSPGERAQGRQLVSGLVAALANATPSNGQPANPPTPPGAATAPGAPTALSATPANAQAVLSWTAPTSNGGAAITDYIVQISTDSGSTWSTFADGTSTATTATVTGLTNGTTYAFRVAAANSVGTSVYSSTATATPTATATAPGAPTSLTATPGNAQAALSWTAPASNGGSAITDYLVEYQPSGGSWSTFADGTSTASTATVTGLTNGTAYAFRVSAVNAVGTGTASTTASATPATPATAVADNFNRSDGSLGTTSTGSKTWEFSGSSTAWTITSNQARFSSSTACNALVNTGIADNYDLQMTAVSASAGTQYPLAIAVRGTSASSFLLLYRNNTANSWALQNSDGTAVQAFTYTTDLVANDVVRVRVAGTTIALYVNGTLVNTWTASTHNTAADTYQGIQGGANIPTTVDDFSVTPV